MVVALDLSPWIRDRLGPAAVRLLEILGELSREQAGIRLLGIAPAGDLPDLPSSIQVAGTGPQLSGSSGLRYTHFYLPRTARQVGADILLLVGSNPPLRSRVPVAALDEALAERSSGGWGRLSEAAGRAGLQVAGRLGNPKPDLPPGTASFGGESRGRTSKLPPGVERWVHADLVLAHGVTCANLDLLLSAWTWVASASDAVLMPLTARPCLRRQIAERAQRLGVNGSVVVPPELEPQSVPELYSRARVLMLSGGLSGASPARWAMANRLPVAAPDEPALAGILDEAGYLVRPGDARALGAACLTLLVDEGLAAELGERGWRRSQSQNPTPGEVGLAEGLRRVLAARPAGRDRD